MQTARDLSIFRPSHLAEWRNWQTRRTQNPVLAIVCRFNPDLGYREKTGFTFAGFDPITSFADVDLAVLSPTRRGGQCA